MRTSSPGAWRQVPPRAAEATLNATRTAAALATPATVSLASPAAAAVAIAAAVAFVPAVHAQPAEALTQCAAIGAAADRLACYDKLAGRAAPTGPDVASVPPPSAAASAATSTSALAPANAPLSAARDGAADGESSLLSKYWELDAADKRGIFNFVGYRPNFVLPVRITNRINRAPVSPTQEAVLQPDYKHVEAKFQLSLRTKLAQDVLLPGADVWAAFTQQAYWQIYNGKDSKPFRNSDYEPELIYVVPTPADWSHLPFGWRWRFTQLGLAHQSNGQSDPLSRSWNRVYLGAGVERGDWSFTTRIAQRLGESDDDDNNPDLLHYRGRAEFALNWARGLHTASLLYRTSPRRGKLGALQFDWSYPIFRDQPNGLRWYVQAFTGYGETLTDYNFRQTSLGAGVSFLQF